MPRGVAGFLARMQSFYQGFTSAQKTLAVIGLGLLAAVVFAVTTWLSQPTMAPLFSGLSATDTSAIIEQLDADAVPYQLADGGSSVLVPADQLYALRVTFASAGIPTSTEGSYALLDDMGLTASDFQMQTTYRRALEGELAKTIAAVKDVDAATVRLALPEESVFVSEQNDPTASVFVQTTPGASLPEASVQAIVHLVSASIDGMTPADVAVIDASGRVLSAVGQVPGDGLSGQGASEYEARVAGTVQTMLDRVLGPGRAVVAVNAELVQDSVQRTEETFSITEGVPPLSASSSLEEYTGAGGTTAGVLGPDNIAVPNGTGTGESTMRSESETVNNPLNKITEQTTVPPGSVRRQSVSVVVDEAVAGVSEAELTTLVSAAAGIDTERGDTVAVAAMAFDTSAAEQAREALAEAEAAADAERRAGIMRTAIVAGALILLVTIMVIVLRLRSSRSHREDLDLGELQILPEQPDQGGAEAVLGALPAAEGGPAEPNQADVLAAKREQIAALVDDRPDEVASMLRDWLAVGRH